MADIISYNEFLNRRFPKAASNPSTNREAIKPTSDMASYNNALENVKELGDDLMTKLIKVLIIVANNEEDNRVPVTYDTYKILLGRGLERKNGIGFGVNKYGTRMVRVSHADLKSLIKE